VSNHGPATELAGPSTSGERRGCLVSVVVVVSFAHDWPRAALRSACLVQGTGRGLPFQKIYVLSTTTHTEQGQQPCKSKDSCKNRRLAKEVKKSKIQRVHHHRGPKRSMPTNRREAIEIDRQQEFAGDVSQDPSNPMLSGVLCDIPAR
jgi:hypothetical protein